MFYKFTGTKKVFDRLTIPSKFDIEDEPVDQNTIEMIGDRLTPKTPFSDGDLPAISRYTGSNISNDWEIQSDDDPQHSKTEEIDEDDWIVECLSKEIEKKQKFTIKAVQSLLDRFLPSKTTDMLISNLDENFIKDSDSLKNALKALQSH